MTIIRHASVRNRIALALAALALCAVWTLATASANSDELVVMLPGDVPLVMVRIPAGTFPMGSPESERGRYPNEGPLTAVTLTRGFFIGKYPVTQAQWLALMSTWPLHEPTGEYGLGDDYPAYWIDWHEARRFVDALNEHVKETAQVPVLFRLPTEAEREHATRAGESARFSFGDSLSVDDECEDDGVRSHHMWYCYNNGEPGMPDHGAKPVGQLLPNSFGLYDMHGNVWEWCEDYYELPGGTVTDPIGPASSPLRAIRGGAWGYGAVFCRSAVRIPIAPETVGYASGFRLAAGGFAPADAWVLH